MITTPDDRSRKDYIGNAAAHASAAVVFAQLEIDGTLRGRARVRRTDPGREGEAARRRPDRGRRRQDRAQRRRQRAALVRRRPGAARRTCSTATRTSTEDGRYALRHRERRPPLLHHARHPDPGPGLRRRRRHHRQQGRARRGDQVRQPAPPVRLARHATRRSCSSTTACTSAGCCRCWRKTYALHFAQEILLTELHNVLSTTDAPDRQRRALESRAAGTKALGTWHASTHHPGVPRGVRRRGLPDGQPARRAARRHRRVHHLRGRQPHPAAAGRQGPADRLLLELRRPRPARHGAVRGRARGRDGGRAHQRPQAARADQDVLPGGDDAAGTRRPGCSTRSTSSRCSAGARSTCSPASPGGSSAAWTRGWTRSRCSAGCRTT